MTLSLLYIAAIHQILQQYIADKHHSPTAPSSLHRHELFL